MENKRRLVVSQKNCSEEVLQALQAAYPNGYGDDLIKVEKPNGDSFYAARVEMEDAIYLVKVEVKIDDMTEEEFDKQYGSEEPDFGEEYNENESNPYNGAEGQESPSFDE